MRSIGLFLLAIISLMVSGASMAEGINGSWEGKLNITPAVSLRFILNISEADNANQSVTMDSPDQGAYGLPMQIIFLDNDSVNVTYPQINLSYTGHLKENSIQGTFKQGALTLPLNLTPKISTLSRPQTPKPPFSYKTEDIEFKSAGDNASLFGTLVTPPEFSPETPVAVLITGSGTQNRDEELFEHKPFAVIADYLANNGIASLRYDDRGYDPSTGLQPNITTQQNALDAEGAINFLKEKGFKNIGIIGHSEGGLIADMIASKDKDLSFIVEIGGPSVSGDKILLYQNEYLLKESKMPENYVSMYLDAMKGLFDSQKDADPTPFNESDYEIFSAQNSANPVLAPLAKNLRENFVELAPWLHSFINYDPLPDIKAIKIPALFIYGEKDTQVPPAINVPVLSGISDKITVKVYPDLNHLMQHSETGSVKEYAEIEETISPEVLVNIKDFIHGGK